MSRTLNEFGKEFSELVKEVLGNIWLALLDNLSIIAMPRPFMCSQLPHVTNASMSRRTFVR